jgi:hypothetical protein
MQQYTTYILILHGTQGRRQCNSLWCTRAPCPAAAARRSAVFCAPSGQQWLLGVLGWWPPHHIPAIAAVAAPVYAHKHTRQRARRPPISQVWCAASTSPAFTLQRRVNQASIASPHPSTFPLPTHNPPRATSKHTDPLQAAGCARPHSLAPSPRAAGQQPGIMAKVRPATAGPPRRRTAGVGALGGAARSGRVPRSPSHVRSLAASSRPLPSTGPAHELRQPDV